MSEPTDLRRLFYPESVAVVGASPILGKGGKIPFYQFFLWFGYKGRLYPVNPAHDLVRWAIARNPLARRLALWADDLAYGRKPSAQYPYPDWHEKQR